MFWYANSLDSRLRRNDGQQDTIEETNLCGETLRGDVGKN